MANRILATQGYKAAVDSILVYEDYHRSDSANAMQKSGFYQAAMTYLSFAGLYPQVFDYENKAFPQRSGTNYQWEGNIKTQSAVSYILEKWSDAPVLLINEAHSRGQNRAFVRSLLPALYQKGFRCLALETLDHNDTLLNQRKYPLQSSGYYCREPAFGQLIRDAAALGFELLAYEDTSAQLVTGNYMDNLNKRERIQAENILAYTQKHPNKKVIVLAGHGHIEKQSGGEWIKMGQRLCEIMGRDLPSIECTAMREGVSPQQENGLYRAAVDSFKWKEPFVLTINDTIYVSPRQRGKVDVSVFMPRTDFSAAYPDWMKECADHSVQVQLPARPDLTGRLLQVYKADEWHQSGKNAVPVLNIPILRDAQAFDLFLRQGAYEIRVFADYSRPLFETSLLVK
ncbi:MAG: erythromycin esterase family protein [Saprospiraceae bacterium]|nr:erythromycin esterase family protein [Saprospiraceae bacterium]